MKKILLFIIICIFLTGCGKQKYTCSKRNEEEKNNTKIEFTFKKDQVQDATAIMTYDDEDTAKDMCNVFVAAYSKENVECKDKTITVNNYHEILSEDYNTKDKITNYYTEHEYTCKQNK